MHEDIFLIACREGSVDTIAHRALDQHPRPCAVEPECLGLAQHVRHETVLIARLLAVDSEADVLVDLQCHRIKFRSLLKQLAENTLNDWRGAVRIRDRQDDIGRHEFNGDLADSLRSPTLRLFVSASILVQVRVKSVGHFEVDDAHFKGRAARHLAQAAQPDKHVLGVEVVIGVDHPMQVRLVLWTGLQAAYRIVQYPPQNARSGFRY